MSESDARDLYRAVSHFSVRTPLSKSFLVDWNERGVDLTNLGSNLDDIFEKMATAYEEWDKMFHLTSVRLLYTKNELLTSAFPTSSFEEGMDIDGVTFPYHVTMAIDRHLLAHVMVRSFDPNERVKQHFWITSAEDQIVLRHNMAQIARFASSEDVEYLVNLGSSSTDLIDRTLSALGWNLIVGRGGRRTFVRS